MNANNKYETREIVRRSTRTNYSRSRIGFRETRETITYGVFNTVTGKRVGSPYASRETADLSASLLNRGV